MTEQLALHQAGRHRRTVENDERLCSARRLLVQRLSNELLACARLSLDQHRVIHRGGALEHGEDHAHRHALPDQPAEALAGGQRDLDHALQQS